MDHLSIDTQSLLSKMAHALDTQCLYLKNISAYLHFSQFEMILYLET